MAFGYQHPKQTMTAHQVKSSCFWAVLALVACAAAVPMPHIAPDPLLKAIQNPGTTHAEDEISGLSPPLDAVPVLPPAISPPLPLTADADLNRPKRHHCWKCGGGGGGGLGGGGFIGGGFIAGGFKSGGYGGGNYGGGNQGGYGGGHGGYGGGGPTKVIIVTPVVSGGGYGGKGGYGHGGGGGGGCPGGCGGGYGGGGYGGGGGSWSQSSAQASASSSSGSWGRK